MRSRAAIFTEPGKPMVVEEVEFSDPAPGDALIKILASGICQSNLHLMRGWQTTPGPTLMGHEATGEVLAVGEGVSHVEPGDRVITSLRRRDGRAIGLDRPDSRSSITWNGMELEGHRDRIFTWADHALIDADYVVKVPEDTPRDSAAPLGCGIITGVGTVINALNVEAGRTCAVYGVGGVGLAAVGALKVRGASRIIAVDLSDEKLEFAKRFGATDVVNASDVDPVTAIRDMTGGGTDYAIDAIGARGTTQQIVDTVRSRRDRERGGTAAMIATGNVVKVPTGSMVLGEKSLIGVLVGSSLPERDYLEILSWHREGLFDLDALVTDRYKLIDINEAAERLDRGEVLGRSIIVF